MSKSKVLGRGLSNLIPDFKHESEGGASNFRDLRIIDIQRNPDQPRKFFSIAEIEELAETIVDVGVIEPIIVREIRKNEQTSYQIISGERRYRAAKIAGYKKIPAIIKQVNEIRALELGIIENIQREDLNPIEEASAYQDWIKKTGYKPSVLAKKIGKNRSTVTNLLRILKLPQEILDLIAEKKLTAGQARPLLSIAHVETQKLLGRKAVQENWNARKVEAKVSAIVSAKSKTKSAQKVDLDIRDMETQLIKILQTKVSIHSKKNGRGSIQIGYSSLEEFERLVKMLRKLKI